MEHTEYLKQFIEDCKRTESTPEHIEFNIELMQKYIQLLIRSSNILDLIKKGLFYNNWTKYNKNVLDEILSISNITNDLLLGPNDVYDLSDQEYIDKNLNLKNNAENCKINTRLFHGLLGNISESGELATVLSDGIETGTVDVPNLVEELFDGNYYNGISFDAIGKTFEESFERGIGKLRVRYPEKFTTNLANNRDLDAERKVLEGKN